MFKLAAILACMLPFLACNAPQPPAAGEKLPGVIDQTTNLLAAMSDANLQGFQWMYAPKSFQLADRELRIESGQGSDFFNDPETEKITAGAPVLYREMSGNFVATALVQPDFADMWNACALMVHLDSLNWIKFGFENSDATGKSIVSVVTRGVSDDSNGAILNDREAIWLRIIRKGNLYALHWSADGKTYKMARLAKLPEAAAVKIGMEAQCPVGKPATHKFLYFSLEEKTVSDLRKGI